jgi:uncharacterized protein YqgC (DUF456 family)
MKRNKRHFYFLAMVMLLFVIGNYLVISSDIIPPLHDANVCYSDSIRYFKAFIHDFKVDNLKILFTNINSYSPLYMLAPFPFYIIFGPTANVMAMFNLFYVFILVVALYKIANFLYGKPAGLLAAILLLTFPSIVGFSRVTHMNIAITSILALNVYFLLRANNYHNKVFSLWAGITALIGGLIGLKYIIYFAGIVLVSLGSSFCSQFLIPKKDRKRVLLNIAIFLLCAILFSALFYYFLTSSFDLPDDSKVEGRNYNFKWEGFLEAITGFKVDSFFLNLGNYFQLLRQHILFPNFLLFLMSVFFIGINLFKLNHRIIFFGWLLSPILLLSLLAFADLELIGTQPRFLLPVLPAVVIMIAGLLSKLRLLMKRYFLYRGEIAFAAAVVIVLFLNYGFFLKHYPYPQNSSELLGRRVQFGILRPVSERSPVSGLLSFLEARVMGRKDKAYLLVIFEDNNNTAPLSLEIIYDQLRKRKLKIKLLTSMGLSIYSLNHLHNFEENSNFIKKVFMSTDYILYIKNKSGIKTMGRVEEQYYRSNKSLKEMFFKKKNKLKLIWRHQAYPQDFFNDTLLLFSFQTELNGATGEE